MLVDRTKHLDKLAFNVQQLRNRYNTTKEEQKRIENAKSREYCANLIEKFIVDNNEPLDTYMNSNNNMNDNDVNIFKKRKPFKFNPFCHCVCPCAVLCVRCCCG